MMRGVMGVAAALLVLSGCGGEGEEPASAPSVTAAPTFDVAGTLEVDLVGSVKILRNPDRCVLTDEALDQVAIGERSLVISGPTGDELALAEFVEASAPTVNEGAAGVYYVPGRCDFRFEASDVPLMEGVYTISLPDFDLEQRFTAAAADGLALTLDR